MTDSNEDKLSDILFDPEISRILELLEDSPANESKICEKLSITPAELTDRLLPLVREGFVTKSGTEYSADGQKLSDAIESSGRFDETIDKVTQMDSYLN